MVSPGEAAAVTSRKSSFEWFEDEVRLAQLSRCDVGWPLKREDFAVAALSVFPASRAVQEDY